MLLHGRSYIADLANQQQIFVLQHVMAAQCARSKLQEMASGSDFDVECQAESHGHQVVKYHQWRLLDPKDSIENTIARELAYLAWELAFAQRTRDILLDANVYWIISRMKLFHWRCARLRWRHLLDMRHSVTKKTQKTEIYDLVLLDPIGGQKLDYVAAGRFSIPPSLHRAPDVPTSSQQKCARTGSDSRCRSCRAVARHCIANGHNHQLPE